MITARQLMDDFESVYARVLLAAYRGQHGHDPQAFDDLQAIIHEAQLFDRGQ